MVKCGPKPKQISARQLRNLVREEKKSKALKRSARPPPTPPSSPRVKKRVYTRRPSQYDVSLSRKKQAKAKQRPGTVRKARTESSLAFSAMYVAILGDSAVFNDRFEERRRSRCSIFSNLQAT